MAFFPIGLGKKPPSYFIIQVDNDMLVQVRSRFLGFFKPFINS